MNYPNETLRKFPDLWLKNEYDRNYCREAGIVAQSAAPAVYQSGTIMAKISDQAQTASAVANAGNTGNGAFGSVTMTDYAKPGIYSLVVTEPGANAGSFNLIDPDGLVIAKGTIASAFTAAGFSFTVADGATDFVAGDAFTIVVYGGKAKWAPFDPAAASDVGEATAAGILIDQCNPTDADVPNQAILTSGPAILVKESLVFAATATAAQKERAYAQLEKLGFKFRVAY